MALFLLQLDPSSAVKYDLSAVVVEADDVATARSMAKATYRGPWGAADATTVAAASDDLEGWVHRVVVSDGSNPDPLYDVSVTSVATDDIDDVGADLAAALVTAGLTASYSSPTLTVAAIGDAIGDETLTVTATPAGGRAPVPEMIGTIVDQGIEAAVLTVVLDAQTAVPNVLATIDRTI